MFSSPFWITLIRLPFRSPPPFTFPPNAFYYKQQPGDRSVTKFPEIEKFLFKLVYALLFSVIISFHYERNAISHVSSIEQLLGCYCPHSFNPGHGEGCRNHFLLIFLQVIKWNFDKGFLASSSSITKKRIREGLLINTNFDPISNFKEVRIMFYKQEILYYKLSSKQNKSTFTLP